MIEIKDLLARFHALLDKGELKKETIRKVLSETLKTEISLKDINIQGDSLYLNIRPIYKSELLLKREIINSKLIEALGKVPGDFR